MLKVILYQCPKCGLGENGNEFMHKRKYQAPREYYTHPKIVSKGTDKPAKLDWPQVMLYLVGDRKFEEFTKLPIEPDLIGLTCRACGYRWEVPCE